MDQSSAKFVWYDKDGKGRNLYALLRRSFNLTSKPHTAKISLFADTAYQVFVNGTFVEFGPVRFDPKHPVYDVIDISPFLNIGANVIAVRVNHYGLKTYKAMVSRGGLRAWGSIECTGGTEIDLTTNSKNWRCTKCQAHERYAQKLSFALNAADFYDQAGEELNWNNEHFDDSQWPMAVELENTTDWGTLTERTIPFMSKKPLSISSIAVNPILNVYDTYSFTLPLPHASEDYASDYSNFIAFSTWIYSPVDQVVPVSVFWGEGWLNGQALPRGIESDTMAMRIVQSWDLKKGWNYYFGKVGAYADILNQYFSVPKWANIKFSALKDEKSPYTLRHTPVFSAKLYNTKIEKKHLPWPSDEKLDEVGGWVYVDETGKGQSPSHETSWDVYGDQFQAITPDHLNGSIIRKIDYPQGCSLFIDMGHMQLMIPRIVLHGARGCTVDVTYTEHLTKDKTHFVHAHHHSVGDRIFCTRDTIDWMPPQPRGTRYIRLTFRNQTDDIRIDSIDFLSANYPVEHLGSFACSDPLLNAIWETGARTQQSCMEDSYIDCPGRERGMYLRDVLIQYKVNLATFGDNKLMQRCVELFGQSPDSTGKFRAVYPNTGDYTISDFSLNMLEGYFDYYSNTGDEAAIRRDWAAIRGNLKWFNELADEREDLLLDAEWHLKKGIKAHYGGFHGDLTSKMDIKGIHCVFSCTYLIALQFAEKLGSLIGELDDVEEYKRRIPILTKSISTKFWDEEKKCFGDNLDRTNHSIQSSLLAARAGAVDKSQLVGVKKHLEKTMVSLFTNGYDPNDGVLFSPSYGYYILDGLYKIGLPHIAERMMRQGWGWSLAQGLKTFPEYFELHSSLCHAWSSGPTYYLSRYVLGVTYPNAPDMSTVAIDIKTNDIAWAKGTYPHPGGGVVEVSWHTEEGRKVVEYVKTPEGVKVEITK